jgi:hypothetical protein
MVFEKQTFMSTSQGFVSNDALGRMTSFRVQAGTYHLEI